MSRELILTRRDKEIYRDGNQKLKIFGDSYPESDIVNEALNQMRVQESFDVPGVIVPKVLEVAILDGKWAIISEYIEGKTLDEIIASDIENRDKYLQRLIDIQVKISAADIPLLSNLADKMHRKIDSTDLTDFIKQDLHESLDMMPSHKKLCHGDFNPTNVIITDNDEVAVVDWSHVTRGNLSADAARTYLWIMFEKGRKAAEAYLDMFCKTTETKPEYVKVWIRLVAAAAIPKSEGEEIKFLHSCI